MSTTSLTISIDGCAECRCADAAGFGRTPTGLSGGGGGLDQPASDACNTSLDWWALRVRDSEAKPATAAPDAGPWRLVCAVGRKHRLLMWCRLTARGTRCPCSSCLFPPPSRAALRGRNLEDALSRVSRRHPWKRHYVHMSSLFVFAAAIAREPAGNHLPDDGGRGSRQARSLATPSRSPRTSGMGCVTA